MAAPGARVAGDPQAAAIGADAAPSTSEGVDITEGQATIQFASAKDVFYNPVQVFNRDLSVAGLQTFCNLFAREKRKQQAKRRSKADSADEGDEVAASAASAGSESVAVRVSATA